MTLNIILSVATSTVLVVVGILLLKHYRSGINTWAGVGLTLSVLCYVTIDSAMVQSVPLLASVATVGAICIPVQFWMLTRAIFDDHYQFSWSIFIWVVVQLIPYFPLLLGISLNEDWMSALKTLAGLTSLSFVVAAGYVVLQTKKADLVNDRIQFRTIFLIGTASVIGVTLLVESITLTSEILQYLQILQRIVILGIALYFLITNFSIRAGFFFREIAKAPSVPTIDPQLTARLLNLMETEKIYRKEGLTIGDLAQLLNEQEYRVRRLINGQLGFRNFNDFLNQYRIKEACEILSDPVQNRKTILEIAYQLGYQSIGPFNKAFKELKGTTPTTYRKTLRT